VEALRFHGRREPENLDEREFGAYAARRLDAVDADGTFHDTTVFQDLISTLLNRVHVVMV
jgi:hypothetical protein